MTEQTVADVAMIARNDWHGVADVAMDLREMEAEQRKEYETR